MKSSLWIALIDNVLVPGTRTALFFQPKQPSDRAIKARFAGLAPPADLKVVGLFDISHTYSKDKDNQEALDAFILANAKIAETRTKVKQEKVNSSANAVAATQVDGGA